LRCRGGIQKKGGCRDRSKIAFKKRIDEESTGTSMRRSKTGAVVWSRKPYQPTWVPERPESTRRKRSTTKTGQRMPKRGSCITNSPHQQKCPGHRWGSLSWKKSREGPGGPPLKRGPQEINVAGATAAKAGHRVFPLYANLRGKHAQTR